MLRLLCSQSEVPLLQVRSGYLSEAEFRRLVNLTGGLYKAPIMIDDSAALTVLEIRAKCRRLKAENRSGMVHDRLPPAHARRAAGREPRCRRSRRSRGI